jgi:hypothetical protein
MAFAGLRRVAPAVTLALALGAAVPPAAPAATFTQPYAFSGSEDGIAGWVDLDNPSPNPWYTSSIGAGGIRAVPTGNGGLVYDNAYRSGFEVDAPAGATITKAVLSGVDALQQDRQRTRINLLPQPSTDTLTGTEPWGRSTVLDGDVLQGTITLTLPGTPATGLQIRHFPVACGDPSLNQPACGPVAPDTAAHARVASVALTLDDPSAPVSSATGPGGAWTKATSVDVTAKGEDPQSGIARLELQTKAGSSTRTTVLGTWAQDTSGDLYPGWVTSRSRATSVPLPRSGTVTITTSSRNGASTDAVSAPLTVRVDRIDPTITWPRKLQGGQSVSVRDPDSGLASVTTELNGRRVDSPCTTGAEQCRIRIPNTAKGRLAITATDVAGNATNGSRTVLSRPGSSGSSPGGSKKPGSRKPTTAYCKKHPTARACKGAAKPLRPKPPRGKAGQRLVKLKGQPKKAGKRLPKCSKKRPCKGPIAGLDRTYQTVRNYTGSYVIGATALGDEWVGYRAPGHQTLLGHVRSDANPRAYSGCGFTTVATDKGVRARTKQGRGLPRTCAQMQRGFPGIKPIVFADLMHRNVQVNGQTNPVPDDVKKDGVLRVARPTPIYRNAMSLTDVRGADSAKVSVGAMTRIQDFAPKPGDGLKPYPAGTGINQLPVRTAFRWRYMTDPDAGGERYLLGRLGNINGVPSTDKADDFYVPKFGKALGWVFIPLSAFVPVDAAHPAGQVAAPSRDQAWRVACHGAEPEYRRTSDMSARDRPRGFPNHMCHWLKSRLSPKKKR